MTRYEPDELPGCSTPHWKCSGPAARLQILCSNVGDAKRALRNPYLIVFALLEIGEVGEDAVGAAASLMSIAHRGNA
jgi:hypothetical protein